jgi:hypothetical protein
MLIHVILRYLLSFCQIPYSVFGLYILSWSFILLPGNVSAPGLFTFYVATAGSLLPSSSYHKVNSGILFHLLSFLLGAFLMNQCAFQSKCRVTFSFSKLKGFSEFKGDFIFCCKVVFAYYLKVPSGQIGSKWEWYHWKALEKDINRYKFLIFYFRSWIF